MQPLLGTFHNVTTGQTVVRELTAEEIAEFYPNGLPQATDETPSTD